VPTGRIEVVVVAIVVALLVPGCGGSADDRAGGKRSAKAVALTFAHPFQAPDELRPFADEVERISGGKLTLRFRNQWLGSPWRVDEAALIRDVVAGKADLGWIGTRAWDDVGVTAFDPLHAPFVIDSYPLQRSVLESRVADEMLEALEPLGLIGLGVLPGPLRKLLAAERPVRRPADFAGLTIGLNRSQLGERALRALGAVPLTVRGGGNPGSVDGLEQHVTAIEGNTYDAAATYLMANVNLWPRPGVVFINVEAYEKLDDSQRDALHEAAQTATPIMLAAAEAGQEAATAELCGRGLKLAVAAPSDLAQLRAAVAPVVERLARDPVTSEALETIQQLRQDAPAAPDSIGPCPVRSTPKESNRLDGTYVTVTTAADARRARISQDDPLYEHLPIRQRLVLNAGVFKRYLRERDGTTDVQAGTYTLYRDRILFVDPPDRLPFAWSFDGDTLSFDDEGKGGYFGAFWAQAWTKIR
jgi:TRAP-type C4-dicarboxylate transport system substrate-binding protein